MVKSPCINICAIDEETGLCIGCKRTRGEISAWTNAKNSEKKKIIIKSERRDTSSNYKGLKKQQLKTL